MFPFDNLNLTIDSIYHKLITRIRSEGRVEDITRQFLTIPEDDEKVLYVYQLLKNYNFIPLIIKEDKCEYTSIHYRNLGNQLYQRSEYFQAWQYYNLALMYSPLDSMVYGLAISNRSAALAGLKEYKACLEDIRMVFSLVYPENIREKLLKRKKMCEDALRQEGFQEYDKHIEDIFLLKSKHEKYQCASSKLMVKYTPEMGRHVVAAEDIEVGELIVQDIPYVNVLLPNQLVISCAHCFSRKYNLYPCPYCCMTMYCSRRCVVKAWEEYHFYECPFIASFIKNDFTKLELLALRTTLRARNDHQTWEELFITLAEVESCTDVENLGCKLDESGDNMVYASDSYHAIHALATNVEKRDVSDLFQKAVSAAVFMHYLGLKNLFRTEDPVLKRSMQKFAAGTLLKHMMTAPTNMHAITCNVEDAEGNYIDEYNIGSGAYAFLSLINHSCSPNVVRYTRLGYTEMNLIAIRPIKKGMQILDNYGYSELPRDENMGAVCEISDIVATELSARMVTNPTKKAHHAVHPREDRQAMLKSQYKFTCICEACINDWPLYHGLKNIPNLHLAIAQKINKFLSGEVIETLQKADKKKALRLFKPLCELATSLEPYIPCKEAAECQEALKQCLAILAGVLPHGFTKFVEFSIPAPRNEGSPKSTRFYTGMNPFDTVNQV